MAALTLTKNLHGIATLIQHVILSVREDSRAISESPNVFTVLKCCAYCQEATAMDDFLNAFLAAEADYLTSAIVHVCHVALVRPISICSKECKGIQIESLPSV